MIQICIYHFTGDTYLYNRDMEITFQKNRIKELRMQYNLSQRQLAEIAGTSQANISRWEKGQIMPSVAECWRLADYFDESIDFLCGRKDF